MLHQAQFTNHNRHISEEAGTVFSARIIGMNLITAQPNSRLPGHVKPSRDAFTKPALGLKQTRHNFNVEHA